MKTLYYFDKFNKKIEIFVATKKDYRSVAINLLEAKHEGMIGEVYCLCKITGKLDVLDYYNTEL